MRTSTRLLTAGLLSVVALTLVPSQGVVASATMKPAINVYCCR
ncbi:MAG TPA: hypothetical protein VFX52_09800 [Nocardioidaceae bacterium]|jgi:hypothetical protein|nr:hypothetical protein [Nocardioidaceae bacterium]